MIQSWSPKGRKGDPGSAEMNSESARDAAPCSLEGALLPSTCRVRGSREGAPDPACPASLPGKFQV